MKTVVILPFSVGGLLLLGACGTHRMTPLDTGIRAEPVTIHIVESKPQVEVSNAFQFHILITNTTYPTCTWSVNGVVGGNDVLGTVTNEGLYSAPASVPTPSQVTVTATATADTTKSDDATVTIQPKHTTSRSRSSLQPEPVHSSPGNGNLLPMHFQIRPPLFASMHDRCEELKPHSAVGKEKI